MKHKIAELECSLSSHKLDIVCLSETWLNHTVPNSFAEIAGYQFVRSDRLTKGRGGGIAAYISDKYSINTSNFKDINISDNDLECMVIELRLPVSKPIIIILCYKLPSGDSKLALDKLQSVIDNINSTGEKFVAGDFNINYDDKDSSLANRVKSFENINNFKQLITSPTRITRKTSTIIVHFYTNSRNIMMSGTINCNISDHLPTFIIRKQPKINHSFTTFTCRKLKHFDNDFFRNRLEELDWRPY